jgi:hypothetical protein
VAYEPAESSEKLKGGNSNWRGPIWFPTTFLIIESLRKLGTAFGSGSSSPRPCDELAPYESIDLHLNLRSSSVSGSLSLSLIDLLSRRGDFEGDKL